MSQNKFREKVRVAGRGALLDSCQERGSYSSLVKIYQMDK
jgi:hypothetical protein